MRININNVKFVKTRSMHVNPFKSTLERIQDGYVIDTRVEGVAVIPYRHGTNGKEILIRDEYTPLRQTCLSLVRGRKDPEDGASPEWWRATARRELLEEAGILAEERWFSYVGELLPQANYENKDILVIVDCTGIHQGRPITDGSIWEKKSTNFWVSIYDVLRMIKEPNTMDNYLLAALTLFLNWCGLITNPIGKSEESDLEKAKKGEQKPGHKYIRREGVSGKYKYIYKEPQAKGPKKADEKKKGKGSLLEQLVAALGKKQGGGEEKKPKKESPFKEFSTIPKEMPEFARNVSAAQWMADIDRRGIALSKNDFDDADIDMMNDPNSNTSYLDGLLKMISARPQQFNVDINIDNKKLDDGAKREVIKAITSASSIMANIKGLANIFNGGVAEKVYENLSEKIEKADNFNYSNLDKLITAVAHIKEHIDYMGRDINDMKWLQGSDPKLDFVVDGVFEAVDGLMRARNRFTKNGLKFYINNITPVVESLRDAEEVYKASMLLQNFGNFIHEAIRVSTTARETESFTNQWNLKEKGIYDSSIRFYSYAAGKIVDKIRDIDNLGDDNITRNYMKKMVKNDAFTFLSMSPTDSPFRIAEEVFSYVDLHGFDKYYQDMVYFAGGRGGFEKAKEKEHYDHIVADLTNAYNGGDVYWNDESLHHAEKMGVGIGSMKKGKMAAAYSALNTMILLNKNVPAASKSLAFIRMWSSASHGSLISNAVEEFVKAKGIDRGTYVNYHIASNRTITPRRNSVKEALANSIDIVYKDTQHILADDKKNKIKLYRGNGQGEIKSVTSSWTIREDVAVQFGSAVSMVEAPRESILLAYDIGNDSFWTYPHEREHVLVPGLLTADKRLNPQTISDAERQAIIDKQLEEEAQAYSGGY
jgi:hypothetical protein